VCVSVCDIRSFYSPTEEEDGPDRVLKSMQGLQCLFLGPICNFLAILGLSVIVPPTAMNRSSFVRVLSTRSGSNKKRRPNVVGADLVTCLPKITRSSMQAKLL
jgi:hypothetical protein